MSHGTLFIDHNIKQRYTLVAQLCAVGTIILATSALAGWMLGFRILAMLGKEYIPMAPSTAISFLALGSALLLQVKARGDKPVRRIVRGMLLAVVLFSLVVIVKFVTGFEPGIEKFLSRTNEVFQGVPVGRMSPVTAALFLLSGLSCLSILPRTFAGFGAKHITIGLSSLTAALGAIMTLSYWRGAPLLYGQDVIPVALPTSIGFFMFGLGLLSSFALKIQTADVHEDEATGGDSLRRDLPAIITLGVGATLAIVTFTIVQRLEFKSVQETFNIDSENISVAVQRSIAENIQNLYAVEGLFASSQNIGRKEFHAFVSSLFPQVSGIRAIGWIPRVPARERTAYETAAMRDGFPHFHFIERNLQNQFVSAAKRDEYFPVYYIEPLRANTFAMGYDVASNPARKTALQKARDTGAETATERISLLDEPGRQSGFLVFHPIYRKGLPYSTLQARRKNLKGFVLGVFRISEVVESALRGVKRDGIEFTLVDDAAPAGERLLYSTGKDVDVLQTAALRVTRPLSVADRRWRMDLFSTVHYLSAEKTYYSWVVLAAGLLFTVMLTLYAYKAEHHAFVLRQALDNIKTLSGLLPICASCKKIRDDKGYWNQVEVYLSNHSDLLFSHGMCPDCAAKAMKELEDLRKKRKA
jgi:CHASE1-domain containing sensor protein